MSTPNGEYNRVIRFAAPLADAESRAAPGVDGLPMRDADHRFEWTRAEFRAWAAAAAANHGYRVATHEVRRCA